MNQASPDTPLHGMRVLIVEDSYLIAARMSDMVQNLGGVVVGPAPTVPRAMELIESQGCHAAILDINLGSATARPVAARLDSLGINYFFVTGYDSAGSGEGASLKPCIIKPVTQAALRRALEAAAGRGGPGAAPKPVE